MDPRNYNNPPSPDRTVYGNQFENNTSCVQQAPHPTATKVNEYVKDLIEETPEGPTTIRSNTLNPGKFDNFDTGGTEQDNSELFLEKAVRNEDEQVPTSVLKQQHVSKDPTQYHETKPQVPPNEDELIPTTVLKQQQQQQDQQLPKTSTAPFQQYQPKEEAKQKAEEVTNKAESITKKLESTIGTYSGAFVDSVNKGLETFKKTFHSETDQKKDTPEAPAP